MSQSKITPEARERCTPHTLADQLAAIRAAEELLLARKLAKLRKLREGSDDWSDVQTAFEADQTGQHKRGYE